jgi:hypothetical protein
MGIEGEGLVFVVYSDAIATMPGQLNPVDPWTLTNKLYSHQSKMSSSKEKDFDDVFSCFFILTVLLGSFFWAILFFFMLITLGLDR